MTPQRTKGRSNQTIPTAQATANEKAIREAYADAEKKARRAIALIQKALDEHQETFRESMRQGRTNWGLVGDLGHVDKLLSEISEFLGKE